MSYVYKATETFWKKFYRLPEAQKASVRQAWSVFKRDPFDARLGSHKIHALSAHYGHPIWSAVIEGDLRVLFRIDDSRVTSLDVGSHKLYK